MVKLPPFAIPLSSFQLWNTKTQTSAESPVTLPLLTFCSSDFGMWKSTERPPPFLDFSLFDFRLITFCEMTSGCGSTFCSGLENRKLEFSLYFSMLFCLPQVDPGVQKTNFLPCSTSLYPVFAFHLPQANFQGEETLSQMHFDSVIGF